MNKIKCCRCQRVLDSDKIDHDNSSAINTCKDIKECNDFIDSEVVNKDGIERELAHISKIDLVQKVVQLEKERDKLKIRIKELESASLSPVPRKVCNICNKNILPDEGYGWENGFYHHNVCEDRKGYVVQIHSKNPYKR